MSTPERKARPAVRVIIMFGGLVACSLLSFAITGSIVPTNPEGALVYQTGLLLLVLGSSVVEHHFTKPADALVNSLAGLLTLVPVFPSAPRMGWWVITVYSLGVFLCAALALSLSDALDASGKRAKWSAVSYKLATFYGRARLYFSLLLLFGIWSFYSLQETATLILIVFWGLYLSLWPLGIPEAINAFVAKKDTTVRAGDVLRVDWPNILRVKVSTPGTWKHSQPKVCRLVDGTTGYVQPLYAEQGAEELIGTGLFVEEKALTSSGLPKGAIGELSPSSPAPPFFVQASANVSPDLPLIGFVVEESEIGTIRIETWAPEHCAEGRVVMVGTTAGPAYYQIVNGVNLEESSGTNRHGYQVAIAVQLGTANRDRGFEKYTWLPWMNAPVFVVPKTHGADLFKERPGEFKVGVIPHTSIPITLDTARSFTHHTAILGVTGSGKTEFAFDYIRSAVAQGTKVVCVDLTARYQDRLSDLKPVSLSIDGSTAKDLSDKLFAVETGQYKAEKEKIALEEFAGKLKQSVGSTVETFLSSEKEPGQVGIVSLPEISNTKATLFITELYLTLLLRYAKEHGKKAPPILIVLEEAHTVIPEATTMGLADFDSKGLVGKMAQIALQGRKYGVGLLVIAQRTATVSKTILTQCNTVVSFACIDDTSIGFLSNVFGSTMARLLPNLPPLHAVVYGKGIRSQRPLVVEIPFSEAKALKDS